MKHLLKILLIIPLFIFFMSVGASDSQAAGFCGIDETGTYPSCPGESYSHGRKDNPSENSCSANSQCCSGICIQPKNSSSITKDTQCNGNNACLQALAQSRALELQYHSGNGIAYWVQKNEDGSYTVVCDNGWLGQTFIATPTPATPPACNVSCPNDNFCQGVEGCNKCLPSSGGGKTCQPAPTATPSPSPTPPAACNVSCTSDTYCQSASDGCTKCLPSSGGGKTCQPAPTATPSPTPAPACGISCTSDTYCRSGAPNNTCTACIGGTCQPPMCGTNCTRPSDCAGARNGCTVCDTSGQCVAPTPTPTTVPACGVACTYPSDCTGSKDACTLCVNNQCVAPTATPTPTPIPFNPAACQCDQISYTSLFAGQQTTITAGAKVIGADANNARIVDQKFFLYEGAESSDTANIIGQSGPIPAVFVSQSGDEAKYQSKWTFNMPQFKQNATYRIQAVINCQPRTTAAAFPTSKTNAVLGDTTESTSFWGSISAFFNRLTGGLFGKAPKPAATPTPTASPVGATAENPEPTVRKNLQLQTFYPAQVYQKTCHLIKFKYNGFQ